MDDLRTAFGKIMEGYSSVMGATNKEVDLLITESVPIIIKNSQIFDDQYKIEGSKGKGNNAIIPWVAVYFKKETTSAKEGVYIVYLLSEDHNKLYLTLNQGVTKLLKTLEGKNKLQKIQEIAEILRKPVSQSYFDTSAIDLGAKGYAQTYAASTIFSKCYNKDSLPSNEELLKDLAEMKELYQKVLESRDKMSPSTAKENEDNYLTYVHKYISSKGFTFDIELLKNYYLCLKSKPFVILAGTSGTGKTRLVRLFAEAVCKDFKKQYKQIAVRPDWSDSSDLLGHLNINGKFIPGSALNFIRDAMDDLDNPYFLCLDEMNLARVEHYFSDVLSIIETRRFENGLIVTDPLMDKSVFGEDTSCEKYYDLYIPQNLYIIGTVNMDETTFPFSKKVLDRANTIEFSFVDLASLDSQQEEITKIPQSNDYFKAEYLTIKDCQDEKDSLKTTINTLVTINDILKTCNSEIGYRIRDEISFYMLNNLKQHLLSENEALDNEIMQKILPRLHGSSNGLKTALCQIFEVLIGDYKQFQEKKADTCEQMTEYLKKHSAKYKNTGEKIASMIQRFDEDGFTSYWD